MTTLTEKQRLAVEAQESARREGVTLVAYAQAKGLEIRELYDSLACLRRKGLLPRSSRKPRSTFVAVRVAAEAPTHVDTLAVCRIVSREGYVIECAEWPPATWLASLARKVVDAAT
jgi:hypothetical protein